MSVPSIDALTAGNFFSAVHGRLDEEAHEPELDAVLLLELVLVPVAQLDHRLHVDLVERGQDRGGRLRLHEALGDALAQPRHRHALARGVATALRRDGASDARVGAAAGGALAPARRRCCRACGFGALTAVNTSPFVMRPPRPVPARPPGSRPGRPSSSAQRVAPLRRTVRASQVQSQP